MDGSLPKIPMSSLQPRKTRRRACTSKVRTGCITCKERRVKCDEVKPACLRCTRAGQTCKGYMPLLSEPRPRKPEPVIRSLLPRQAPSQSSGLAITVGRALPSIRLYGSDVLYFDFFRSEAVKELSGYLPSSFWSRTVLCETLTDPCIRHAILALGAAAYPLVARNQHLPLSPNNDAIFDTHGRAAICHHTKALALFREMMANGIENFPSRSAFIVTPLLVAFTMLQSNHQAAEALLSGLRAMQEVCHTWQGKKVRGGLKSPLVNDEMERITCLMLQVYSKQQPIVPENRPRPYSAECGMDCVGLTLSAAGRETAHVQDVWSLTPGLAYQSLAQTLEADLCFRSAMRPQPIISNSERQRFHHAEQHVP